MGGGEGMRDDRKIYFMISLHEYCTAELGFEFLYLVSHVWSPGDMQKYIVSSAITCMDKLSLRTDYYVVFCIFKV